MKKMTLLALLLSGLTNAFSQVSLCEEATSITLPYATSDDTANYGNNYDGYPGSLCGTPNNFLYGNDVVYAYTATFDGSINLSLSTNIDDVGIFVYSSCEDIGQNCLAGITNQQIPDNTISIPAFPVTSGMTYYFVISTWAPPDTATYSLNIAANTCTNATATYTIVSDCSVTEQFLVAVAIDDMGSAASLTVTDDQGNTLQNVTATGTVTFGPYPNGTPVQFTIANDQDPNCFLTSAVQIQTVCAPVNNFCAGAIDLGLQTSPLSGTTIGATDQNNTSCSQGEAGDVYYSIEVPQGMTLTIGQIDNDYDSVVTAFFGDCTNQVELTCFDDDDLTVYTFFNNTGEIKTFYWVQDGYNGTTGNFTLDWHMSDCITPSAICTVIPDCANGEQFLMNVEVPDLGSASSVTVTDDQGSDPQTISASGTLAFGPYPNATPVIFTVVNDANPDCFFTTEAFMQFDCPPTCTNATVNFITIFDCPNTNGYYINADVTDLGTATSVTLSDDQESDPKNITATGVYQFGPYPDYTPVVFTVSDDIDGDCVLTYPIQSSSNCPPANDNCSNAIALLTAGDLASGALITTNHGAIPSAEMPMPVCGYAFFGYYSNDVWYTAVVPDSGSITIQTAAPESSQNFILMDTALQLYSGDCNAFSAIECTGSGSDNMNTYAAITLTGRTPGEVIYIRAYGTWGSQGEFVIAAYDASLLSTPSSDNADFRSFPNPVKDILNLTYSKNITTVRVFNLLGQEVITKPVAANWSQIDMSNLSNGTYLVKITAANQMKTIKVVKE